ncbi:MAG: MAPEG family protein [Rhodoferax sp.]
MANSSATVLTLLILWALVLLVLMEVLRTRLVVKGAIAGPQFRPDNANLSPFMQRLARAQSNCIEGLPIFGGLLIVALLTQRAGITDVLAPWLLLARVIQSCAHLSSLSVVAVNIRFVAFTVQMVIALYWCGALLQ